MTMYVYGEKKDFVDEKFSQEIIINSLMEDHYY
jgi:hypothetical protein